MTQYTLRRIEPADKAVVTPLLEREWGSTEVVALALGGVVDAAELPGWLATWDGSVVGLLTYLVAGETVELVTINTRALRFYQRAGFRFRALRVDAVTESRKVKPQIPELGYDDIPIRDELELELLV